MLFFTFSVSAQIHWLQVSQLENGKSILFDRVTSEIIAESSDVQLINYNPSISLQSANTLDLSDETIRQCNIFTVFKPSLNSHEELIWQIKNGGKDQLLLTNERVADLTQGKFMNFVGTDPIKTQINSYHHYRNKFDADKIVLGDRPSNASIPVGKYEGEIAEMIVFNHKLAPISQQILETHLALKYSVPLQVGLDYLDGRGKEIWKYEENKEHSNNIAGIGRNDELHFNQKQSKAAFGDGFIAFGAKNIALQNDLNHNALQNQEYLMWGDDNGILDFEEIYSQVSLLQRTWKMNRERYLSSHTLSFQLSHLGLDKSKEDNFSFWLQTSKNTLDKIDLKTSKVYPLIKERHSYIGQNINTEDLDYFSIIKAPNLWMQIELEQPICGTGEQGNIHTKPIGGQAPFSIILNDIYGEELIQHVHSSDDIFSIYNLDAAQYVLNIMDANGSSWQTNIFLNSSGLPSLDLPSKMVLADGETAFLDSRLDIDQSTNYQWTYPNGDRVGTSEIEISNSGIYMLLVEVEECRLWHHLEVIQEKNNIVSTAIFPNPSVNGHFSFSAELKEPAPYSITISDVAGHVIHDQSYKAAKYVTHNNWIQKSGMYFITLISKGATKTEKLVVVAE